MLKKLDNTELSHIVKSCPMGIAISDEKKDILWVNDSFQSLLDITAEEIYGININQLPESLKPLFLSASTVHIPANAIRDDQWFMCSQAPLNDSGHSIHYITDVAPEHLLLQEREELKYKLKDALAVDDVTGMPNKTALFQSLDTQISRSRRYNNLLSIVVMRVNHLADLNEKQSAALLLLISQMLNDQVRWADIVGKLSGNEFLLVLPETDNAACKKLSENLSERLNNLEKPDSLPAGFTISANFGYSEWKKGDDLTLLLQRALQLINKQ